MTISNSLKDLPLPVRRYLEWAFPKNAREIRRVQLRHGGGFKTAPGKGWLKISGRQSFRCDRPEFKWTGRTFLFKAVDQFAHGKGSLRVWLLGLVPIVKEQGPHVDQGELLRWLVEGIWFPTTFLPSENLSWIPVDDRHARLCYHHREEDYYLDFSFHDSGQVQAVEAMRYMDRDRMEKWVGTLSDYREVDGFKVPMRVQVRWELEEGPFEYVDFRIRHIAYTYD